VSAERLESLAVQLEAALEPLGAAVEGYEPSGEGEAQQRLERLVQAAVVALKQSPSLHHGSSGGGGGGGGGGGRSIDDDDNDEKISFRRFGPGRLVLFLPVYPKQAAGGDAPGLHYLAFNVQCPRHYLSPQSADLFRASNGGKHPHFIVGRVVLMEVLVAGAKADAAANPFDLAPGAEFTLVTVESAAV